MKGITTTAGMPTGGGVGSKPEPERTEAKKPEPAPETAAQQPWVETIMDWIDFGAMGGKLSEEQYARIGKLVAANRKTSAVPMTDYFKEQQEISLQWPEIDGIADRLGMEPFSLTERS